MLIPLVNYFYLVLLLLAFFVPIMGRRGAAVNPDFIIASMVVFITHLVSSFALPQVPKSGLAQVKKVRLESIIKIRLRTWSCEA